MDVCVGSNAFLWENDLTPISRGKLRTSHSLSYDKPAVRVVAQVRQSVFIIERRNLGEGRMSHAVVHPAQCIVVFPDACESHRYDHDVGDVKPVDKVARPPRHVQERYARASRLDDRTSSSSG